MRKVSTWLYAAGLLAAIAALFVPPYFELPVALFSLNLLVAGLHAGITGIFEDPEDRDGR